MSDFAQTVKQQADIVKIIGGYIRLRKAGAQNYSGLCPFHKEKSPSFSVHASRQFYHCFGCGQSGDIFSFVSKIENVSFPESVRIVAQKSGIPLPKREYSSPEEAAEASLRRRLLDLHEAATAWFEEQLRSPEGALAREYLANRGVSPEAIKLFGLGYAPDNFNALRDRLSSMADPQTLRASGLFSSREDDSRLYDRFRKRIMFPINNESGRVIAFTARSLDTAGNPGEKVGPKYLNSPETPLYSKGQILFNLDKAKAQMRAMEFALLVEGQMDCISVFMKGIQNVIATSGTAFTEQQVNLLRRHTTNVVVNFDPDAAGSNAAEKSISLLTEEGFTSKVVTLDGGLDPDRFIRERGVEAYAAAIRSARRRSDYLIDRALQIFPGSGAEVKVKQLNYLLPHIRHSPHKLERDQFAHDAAHRLGIDSAVLREELRQAALKRQEHVELLPIELTGREQIFLRVLIGTDPELNAVRATVSGAIESHPFWFEQLATFPSLQALTKGRTSDPMDAIVEPEQRSLVAKAVFNEAEPLSESYVRHALTEQEADYVQKQLRQVIAEIAEAENKGGWEEALKLNSRRAELERRMRALRDTEIN